MMQQFGVVAGAALLAASWTGGAAAQEPADRIGALKECRAIAEAADRLACYDRVSGDVVEAADRGEIRILTQQDVEETQRGLFGFTLPKLNLFGGDRKDGPEALETLESVITSARQLDRTTYVFKIRDGDATWQIKEAPSRFIPPRSGDKVVFKRAALGAYFIRVNGQVGIKGRRID